MLAAKRRRHHQLLAAIISSFTLVLHFAYSLRIT